MAYRLEIYGGRGAGQVEVDCLGHRFRKPGPEELKEYIEFFSGIVGKNHRRLKFVVSDTLTRVEGRTYFFDRLSRYLQLLEIVESEERTVVITNLDRTLLKALSRQLRERGVPHRSFGPGAASEAQRLLRFPLRVIFMLFGDIASILISALFQARLKDAWYHSLILSFYDYRCSRDGSYVDAYFQPLIEHLIRQGRSVAVLSTPITAGSPKRLLKYMRGVRKALREFEGLAKPCEVVFYYRLLRPAGVLMAYMRGLSGLIRLREKVHYSGRDITFLLSLSLFEDYLSCQWAYAWKQYYLFRRLFRAYGFDNVIYPYENHPWEKLLVTARNVSGSKARITAFQHTSISFKLLQYFPGSHERYLPFYPDRILAAGDILRDVMNEVGSYREGLVQSGCALRHDYLFGGRNAKIKKGPTWKIAYAFSFDTKVYPGVIERLAEALGGTRYTVYLKIHPLVPEQDVIRTELPANLVPAKNMRWAELFREIDILLYDDNSLGIEALKYGVEVAYFGLADGIYNCDRLFKYERGKTVINSVEELRSFVRDYYARAGWSEDRDEYSMRYLHSYFLPITEERLEKFA